MGSKMCTHGVLIELFSIISLERDERQLELGCNISMKGLKTGENIRFAAQRKCPHIMSQIINQNKVIFES